ncbi:MAG: response regulator [Anaerohalosphaeraceae bacterium]|nr:response regulator [Anaerohalosphaeraceae bacterium]
MLGLFKKKGKVASAKILVVDDEPDLVSTIKSRLQWAHFKVVTASNGQEGLEVAESQKPDLILLDNNMPVMNGLEMLDHLRQTPSISDIPVIMLTAVSEPEKITTASGFGIVDYITKPFNFSELTNKITAILEQ